MSAQADPDKAQSVSRRQAIFLAGSLATASTIPPSPALAAETVKAVGIDSAETVQLGQSGQHTGHQDRRQNLERGLTEVFMQG